MRHVYLRIEEIAGYSPVEPSPHGAYRRDCLRGPGHEDATIPPWEVDDRRLDALVYREYLDPGYLVPKPDRLVLADVNEPVYTHRVPGTVIYARPGERLHVHVLNAAKLPHSLHVHGLRYGIDSDGTWPLGTQTTGGLRSDEICPGQHWTYRFEALEQGAFPFQDHCKHRDETIHRGLFGGIVVLPEDIEPPSAMELPPLVREYLDRLHSAGHGHTGDHEHKAVLAFLEEWCQLEYAHPRPGEMLHVPLFLHTMSAETPSTCLNGRVFVGNTPIIAARAGQRIRWYVFNLDTTWHNFHHHATGPAAARVVETQAPPVLLPPEGKGAKRYDLTGDFLVHCDVPGLVRSTQAVWLTDEQADHIRNTTGLPTVCENRCPEIDLDRPEQVQCGEWRTVPGSPEVCLMHAMLIPGTPKVMFFGYGDTRDDLSRIWDHRTGALTRPANQPFDLTGDRALANIWSAEHTYLADGKILVHGGFTPRETFLFDPATLSWSRKGPTAHERFYSTTLTTADGRALTLFGSAAKSLEVYDGTWLPPVGVPPAMNHHEWYPWAYVLPDGRIFIAGPHTPTHRFRWHNGVTELEQFATIAGDRSSTGEKGTSVLLPLRPPDYVPRVLIAGGDFGPAQQTAEWIDLTAPVWRALPNLSVPRAQQVNTVLLPDGRVLLAGGVDGADGGPVEIFDPRAPELGWERCATMRIPRGYHSTAILLPDGSVLMGGDKPGQWKSGEYTEHERYFPPYFAMPRPVISSAPAVVTYGATFAVDATDVAEVVLLRPGAVTHGFNMSQRLVECAVTGQTVTAPPNGNVAPPGPYLLFVVNAQRVPSEGRWIILR